METEGQWCDNASGPDCGQSGANNIKMGFVANFA
jgi:hypothetical protein